MVLEQIEARGIRGPAVLKAMRKVPRHLFVQEKYQPQAYEDNPLAIGLGQTISQPYIVALMTQSLSVAQNHRVLEVGTGSGYQTAILAELAKEVYTIERHLSLLESARQIFENLAYKNIFTDLGDGSIGLTEFAPFDRIIVTAGAPKIPELLIQQLTENGRIVIPVGDHSHQDLYVGIRKGNSFKKNSVCGCVFVPLIGQSGWKHE